MASRVLVSLRVASDPARAFKAFTAEIGTWWRPNPLFAFTPRSPGVLAFEGGAEGRLIERLPSGKAFEIGRVKVWAPPRRLVFSWRQASFAEDQETEVEVRFDQVDDQTRVTIEHRGWDGVPQEHVARHGFPPAAFLQRHAEWWRDLLGSLRAFIGPDSGEEGKH